MTPKSLYSPIISMFMLFIIVMCSGKIKHLASDIIIAHVLDQLMSRLLKLHHSKSLSAAIRTLDIAISRFSAFTLIVVSSANKVTFSVSR